MKIIDSRPALLDTNVLVYADVPVSEFHVQAKALRDAALTGQLHACIAQQNLIEYVAILSDPRRVAQTVPPGSLAKSLTAYRHSERLGIIHPNDQTLDIFRDLLRRMRIQKQGVFDAYLVATMLSAGIKVIYSADKGFGQFSEITAINPFA